MPASILIVDDSPANLLVLESVLAPLERRIVRATSGEAALRECLSADFAVILLDVKMTKLDGFETAALIRARPRTRDVPIIFVTAYDADLQQAHRAYGLGAIDYLTKPLDVEIVRYKVAAFVRLYEQGEQLRRLADELATRERFIGILGHDLRNPLATIDLVAQVLASAPELPADLRKHVGRVAKACTQMTNLVGDVLDLTRGQLGGGIPVRPENIDLAALCSEITDEMQALHPERKVLYSGETQCEGQWDRARIAQVITNLVGNALQHCKASPIRVELTASAESVSLAVCNPGHIPAAIAERLFEPFRRGDQASKGLGLGLYIVREIVRSHGGRIDVSSDETAHETTFTVTLPRAR